jgi:hypothetical protein
MMVLGSWRLGSRIQSASQAAACALPASLWSNLLPTELRSGAKVLWTQRS